jgi:hypothetical protein
MIYDLQLRPNAFGLGVESFASRMSCPTCIAAGNRYSLICCEYWIGRLRGQ